MKDEIRKKIKIIRNNMPKSEVFEKSEIIKNKLFKLIEFHQASTILFYISYDNEVFTHDMIKECLSMEKMVVVPKSITKNSTLIISKLVDWNDLEIGAYNILEPKNESIKEIPIRLIDLIIVPGVVFDLKGNRIGHGKGYYDRLLNSCNCISVGLSFEFQLVDKIPIEKYDKKVNIVVTEKRILIFY
jgi:5-formyltetrahydrofolate cyclo-ligase